MNDLSQAEQAGRRVDRLFFEQKLIAWTHGLLCVLAGLTCVISIMLSYEYGKRGLWPRYGSQFLLIIGFFIAAFPVAASYGLCVRRFFEERSRTIAYLPFLVLSALMVDIGAAILMRHRFSFFWLLVLYFGQLSIYGYVGEILLGNTDDDL